MDIIHKGSKDTCTQSKIDGIGSHRGSIPRRHLMMIWNLKEFDMCFDNNENFERFILANPQYDARYAGTIKYPDIIQHPVSHDFYNINTGHPIGKSSERLGI